MLAYLRIPCLTGIGKGGLHDAVIVKRAELCERKLDRKKHNNCMELQICADYALFDTTVHALRFYNFKEIMMEDNIEDTSWMCDYLDVIDGKYVLSVEFRRGLEIIHYKIRFTECRVIRTKTFAQ